MRCGTAGRVVGVQAGWWQGRREAGRPGEGDMRWERLLWGQTADTCHRHPEVEAGRASGLRIHISGPLLCSRCPSSPPYLISLVIHSPRISDYHIYHWASRMQEGSSDRWPCSRLPASLRGDVHSFIRSLTQLLLIKYLRGTNTFDR